MGNTVLPSQSRVKWKHGVIVRAMAGYKLPGWIRISVGTAAQNDRCLEVLDRVFG